MPGVLTELDQATPAWLTETLHAQGALSQGEVMAVEQTPVWAASRVAHLSLRYSADAPASAPAHLLLKLANPEQEQVEPRRNEREVAFYQAVAHLHGDLPVVRCYAAVYVHGTPDAFHLLLDDPAATTHLASSYTALPASLPQSEQMIDALAQVHARCWDSGLPGTSLGDRLQDELASGEWIGQRTAWMDAHFSAFLDRLGDRVSDERRTLYERVATAYDTRLIARHAQRTHLTLSHGDVHLANFLFPRDAGRDGAYIIDWKRAALTLGAYDLADMMALSWFPERRARLERPLLRRYHQRLVEQGVRGYGWDDLWTDYRLSVLRWLYHPAYLAAVGGVDYIWWPQLEKITLAIQDLQCLDLL